MLTVWRTLVAIAIFGATGSVGLIVGPPAQACDGGCDWPHPTDRTPAPLTTEAPGQRAESLAVRPTQMLCANGSSEPNSGRHLRVPEWRELA